MKPKRVKAANDPYEATAQTIRLMADQVSESATPDVRNTAVQAASQFGGLAGSYNDAHSLASAAWWWCKLYIKFVHHELLMRRYLGEAGNLQGLIDPDAIVKLPHPEGDCAIFSECIAAFLDVYGIPWEFVTVAVNPQEPDIFGHVFVYAIMPDGSRLPLDASHGDYPGWQVPSSHVSRRQVWDSRGNPVSDKGSRFEGLGVYGIRTGMGTLICDELGENCVDDGTTSGDATVSPTPTVPFIQGGLTPGQPITATGPSTSGGVNWGSLVSNELAQWTKIAGNVIAPQYTYVRGPNGQLMISGPAGSATTASALASTTSSWMPFLLIAGVGIFALAALGKR